jgi:hypothetical protein
MKCANGRLAGQEVIDKGGLISQTARYRQPE